MRMEAFSKGNTILLDKPYGWSSFQLVKKVRFLVKEKKVGHAGTLDPLATGLMIVCTGKHTKKIHQYQGLSKTYQGTITLGSTTPSYDLETEINNTFPTNHITEKKMEQIAKRLTGKILQKPPAFSALKINGKRSYLNARKGNIEPLPPREVQVEFFEINPQNFPHVQFTIKCSKGTYIRSLADQFGKMLDSGAHLTQLCRTHIGEYALAEAEDVETFEKRINKELNIAPPKET